MSLDDDSIRSILSEARGHSTDGAGATLEALRPAMRRARLRRHIAAGSMTAALLGITGAGVVAVNATRPSSTVSTQSATTLTEPTSDTTTDSTTDSVVVKYRPEDDSTAVSGPPGVDNTALSTPGAFPATTLTSSDVSSTVAVRAVPTSPPAPTPTVTAAPPPPTEPPTTPDPSVAPTTVSSGSATLDSNCGSVTVNYEAQRTQLDNTQANSGFVVDVKNSGPEEVEIGFSDGQDECELKARMIDGALWTFVDNHDEE